MDELTERRLRQIPWPLDDEPNPEPVMIDPPVRSDEWLEGWAARRDACLEDAATAREAGRREGRASVDRSQPTLLICILATAAFIVGVVIGAAL